MGENWKIHPEWVYCKYHYKEFHEFKDNEGELREFLRKIVEPGWKWLVQYEADDDLNQDKDIDDGESKFNASSDNSSKTELISTLNSELRS